MENKLKTCFRLMAVISVVSLFSCPKAIAISEECRKRQEELNKLPPVTLYRWPDGSLQTSPPPRVPVLYPNAVPWGMVSPFVKKEEPIVIKKETPPVPLWVQAANLRNAFGKIPMSGSEEVNNALNKSFEAQLAKIIHEFCREQKRDISEIVSEEFTDKNTVAAKVQIIATDEYKKAALEFLKSCNPRVKIEVSKLQKLNNSIDANNSISFDLSSWQSKRHPVNPHYIGHILDRFSDSNNPANIEAVYIFNLLKAESLNSSTANLSPAEDVNLITEPIESPATPAPIVKAN